MCININLLHQDIKNLKLIFLFRTYLYQEIIVSNDSNFLLEKSFSFRNEVSRKIALEISRTLVLVERNLYQKGTIIRPNNNNLIQLQRR